MDEHLKQPRFSRAEAGGFSSGELAMPSVRDVLRVGFRHKWLIVAVFVSIGTLGTGYALKQSDVYRSSGSVLLRDERGSLAIDPASEEIVTAAPSFSTNPSGSEYAILTSQDLAEEVVREIGAGRILGLRPGKTVAEAFAESEDPEAAAARIALRVFTDNLSISRDGSVIEIGYTHGDPQTAQSVVTQVLVTYQNRHIATHSSSASPEFLREKLSTLDTELKAKRRELAEDQAKYSISSVTIEKEATRAAVNGLDLQLTAVRIDLETSQGRLNALAQSLGGRVDDTTMAPAEIANPEVVALREQLNNLRAEKVRLGAVYVGGTQLRSVNAQITDTEAKIKTLPPTVPRPPGGTGESGASDPSVGLETAKIEHSALLATKQKIEEELASARVRLKALEQHEWSLTALEREVQHLNEQYWATRQGLDLTEREQALNQARVSNVSVLQPATLPDVPEGPRRMRTIAMSFFVGLMMGLGLAFVREFFDATLKSRDEAEKKLGMTVLAVVPEREFRKCI